jgi:hypothetical protein
MEAHMERVVYCRHCEKEHVVSETMDSKGNVVGLFCNTKQAMLDVTTTKWNGEDIYPELRKYLERHLDKVALKRIKLEKIVGLSRKMAYLFMQTPYAKEHRLNYYFVQHHALDLIRRLRCRPEYYMAGE